MLTSMRSKTSRRFYLVAFLLSLFILLVALADSLGKNTVRAAVPPQSYLGGTSTPTPTCGPVWSIEYSPNQGNVANTLAGVDDVGNGHLWAVGSSQDAGARNQPVAQYWDGSQWNVTATPPMTESGTLTSVDARAENDVWAVGSSSSVMGDQTLILHWNGTAWSLVPSPNRSAYQFRDYLMGVTAVSVNDVWAVGYYKSQQGNFFWNTLILHWDGTTWNAIDSPNGPDSTNNFLTSIDATAADDIWSVGSYWSPGQIKPLTMHWDGSDWSVVDVGILPGTFYDLTSVSAFSSNEVWAVGSSDDDQQTYAIRWDGNTWQTHNPSNPSTHTNRLNGVRVIAPGDVWAVGTYATGSLGQDAQTLTEHWIGGAWHYVPSANGAMRDNYLNSVAVGAAGEMWAVGNYASDGLAYNLTLRYPADGCVTPGITVTPTPIILPSRTPTPTYTPSCGLEWRTVPSDNTLINPNYLNAVAVFSESDAWAVGTNLQHWDGTSWSRVPDMPSGSSISGTASDDVWMVGTEDPGGASSERRSEDGVRVPLPLPTTPPGYHTRIYHWNGLDWSHIPSPNPDSFSNFLTDAAAIAPDDAWAVGYYASPSRPLTLHWDGKLWSVVPSPTIGGDASELVAVYAVASDDVWAAGHYYDSTTQRYEYLVMHWDGAQWSITANPPPNPKTNSYLFDIQGTGPDDIWAVGTAIFHWDGSQWTEMANPVAGSQLRGIVAMDPDNVWLTGSTDALLTGTQQTVVLHWDGSQWTRFSSPNPDPYSSALYGAAAGGPTSIWSVGYIGLRFSGTDSRTLVEHYSDPCTPVTPTPTPDGSATVTRTRTPTRTRTATPTSSTTPTWTATRTATRTPTGIPSLIPSSTPGVSRTATPTVVTTATLSTPATSTSTPTSTSTAMVTAGVTDTPATGTRTTTPGATTMAVTMTPTVCPIEFTDVPEGSTFYSYVRCLACRGIINGYPNGTFKPNNLVTRGQLSKIVANSAGFIDPQTAQMFQDVPVGSTFFDFIGRLASRGYISGYPCGGPGEQCLPPGNLPYFRPNNNATRGQISKIVANAAGFSEPHTMQTFQDVPVGSTFYDFIERLASRAVMSGYPCNSVPTEPCVPPENRPYFRPNNNATRGQTSKIVSNTFFPGCDPRVHAP